MITAYELELQQTISRLDTLALNTSCHQRERNVFVDIADNSNPEQVIKDLIALVKLSRTNDSYSSYIDVNYPACILGLSYHKKVVFKRQGSIKGQRISKAQAIKIIKSLTIAQ